MVRKAALYLRSSTDRHDVSVDSQGRELRKFAKKIGDTIVAEFSDRVESAKTDDRPGFQAMIAEAKKKNCQFRAVYCYDTSRFSRRQYHAQLYKHLLKSLGVELIFLKLPKTDTILDPIIESLMEAFDEFHSQKSKVDGLRGMRENIKQGWRAGGRAILGYKLDKQVVGIREGQPLTKSKLVPDHKTFIEVQKYLKGRARGEPRKALQAQMTIDVSYSSLVYFEDSALTYAGHTVWNRHKEFIDGAYSGPGTGRYRPRVEWEIHRDTHEAAISDEEAEAIFRERNKQKIRQSRYRRNHYLLSCLMKCKCGANVDGAGGYYRCHDQCGIRSIKKETLERAVLDELFASVFTGVVLADLQAEIRRLFNENQPRKNHLRQQLRKEIKYVDKQISELAAMLTEVQHRRPLIQRMDALEDERQGLERRLADQEKNYRPHLRSMSQDDLDEFVTEWRTTLEGGTMDRRKAVFRQLIDSATFDGEELILTPNKTTLTVTRS